VDFRFQSSMHWAAFRYLEQPLFLVFVQIATQLDNPVNLVDQPFFRFAIPAIFGMNSGMPEANCDTTQVYTFALRIQTQCHGCAGPEAGKYEFVR